MKKIILAIALITSFLSYSQDSIIGYYVDKDLNKIGILSGGGSSSSSTSQGYTYLDITQNNQNLVFSSTVKTWVRVLGDYDVDLPSNMPTGLPVIIQAMEGVTDSVKVNITEDVRFSGLKNYADDQGVSGFYLPRLEKASVTEDDNDVKDVNCVCNPLFSNLFGDFAGSAAFPSSTNDVWTDETTVTITNVSGSPTKFRAVSVNTAGSDVAKLDLGVLPTNGQTARLRGNVSGIVGTGFTHIAVQQDGGSEQAKHIATADGAFDVSVTFAAVNGNNLFLLVPTDIQVDFDSVIVTLE